MFGIKILKKNLITGDKQCQTNPKTPVSLDNRGNIMNFLKHSTDNKKRSKQSGEIGYKAQRNRVAVFFYPYRPEIQSQYIESRITATLHG